MVRLCVEGYVGVLKDAFVNINDAFMYTQYMLVRALMGLRNVCQCAHTCFARVYVRSWARLFALGLSWRVRLCAHTLRSSARVRVFV